MTAPITEERPDTRLSNEDGDHERFSHYVDKTRFDLTLAIIEGTPVQAVCGKVWVPMRDPKKYPVCPECKDFYEASKRD